MTAGSPLDRIEAWAKFALKNGGPEDKFEVVLALVNVAKAAEAFGMGDSEWRRVEEALAALGEKAGGK